MRVTRLLVLLCFLVGASCAQPNTYSRVIIDTYPATSGPGSVDTKLSLFDDAGNLVATESDGNPTVGFARIDDTSGLTSGIWYIKVEGETGTEIGPYAIRVLLAPDENYASWWFSSYNNPDSYEPDDASSGNVPTNPIPIAVNGKLNRYLTAGDIDWCVLSLP